MFSKNLKLQKTKHLFKTEQINFYLMLKQTLR